MSATCATARRAPRSGRAPRARSLQRTGKLRRTGGRRSSARRHSSLMTLMQSCRVCSVLFLNSYRSQVFLERPVLLHRQRLEVQVFIGTANFSAPTDAPHRTHRTRHRTHIRHLAGVCDSRAPHTSTTYTQWPPIIDLNTPHRDLPPHTTSGSTLSTPLPKPCS